MKKFLGKSNAFGPLIKQFRKNKSFKRSDLSRELDLLGVPLSGDEIYRIETQNMTLKDFELIAICLVLDISLDDLIKVIKENK